ncbi:hypothetical protein [Pseudonocardia parietis]|uniref:Autophagy-related protein 2 n=1 Tax=Pseudonocardia parietis TaxID=570936 RepID=A0ABS4VSY1_9PSEU|nr:hypothetical protein [Pseudonocardia parietis]MBP2367038.1 hypothetical protein [Pseudonocardia parietis]
MTEQDGRNGPDPGQDAPLDPESAVDELEERIAGRRTGTDDSADSDEDDDGTTPVEGDSGTGVNEESPG